MAGYYDKNKDYSAAIEAAKKSGASQAEINRLQQERQNKIDAVYGGNEPNMYNSNQTYSQATSGGGSSSSVNNAVGVANSMQAKKDAAKKKAQEAAARGDWDAVGNYVNEIAFAGPKNAQGGYDFAEANAYMNELQKQYNYNANDYYQGRYDAVYGEGAWDGGTGTGQPTYNEYSQNLVNQYNQQHGIQTSNPMVESMKTEVVNPYQYGTFEEFLSDMGYDTYADATQQAIRAAVQQAISGYNQQIEDTNEDSKEMARQAYVNMMMGGKNLDQQLAAGGYAGGMADSQRIALQAGYENDLNSLERQRVATINELQRAITNAQLTGDMQTAQELASYLQQIQGQWNNYVTNQQAMANDNYWRQQSIDADNQNRAREMALMIMQSGNMPDDETLSAAGISRTQAQALLGTTGQTISTTTNPVRRTGGYNNGGLTRQQVAEMQNYLGVTADGLWGSNSRNAAGGLTADEAWAAYQQALAEQQNPVTEEYATKTSARGFGTNYSEVLNQVRNMKNSGANETAIANYLDQFSNAQLTDAGLERILTLLNIGGYRTFSGIGGL